MKSHINQTDTKTQEEEYKEIEKRVKRSFDRVGRLVQKDIAQNKRKPQLAGTGF